jgi:hypothetical protein
MFGLSYDGQVVDNAGNSYWSGSGVATGDILTQIVGYEFDGIFDNGCVGCQVITWRSCFLCPVWVHPRSCVVYVAVLSPRCHPRP